MLRRHLDVKSLGANVGDLAWRLFRNVDVGNSASSVQ